jgi:peptidyl-tRNA hydrolase, PTH1 family
MYYIIGLGNPGDEYKNSRHNTGRMLVEYFHGKNKFPKWEFNKKIHTSLSAGKIGKEKVTLVLPETFMNKSGSALKSLITSKKKAENMVVIYDDLDLPIGKFKISFGRGSGGHRGIESIIRSVKTKYFIRVRVGISPATLSGKLKKPSGEKAVVDFILGDFKKKELETIKKISKKINDALIAIIVEGKEKAMGKFN